LGCLGPFTTTIGSLERFHVSNYLDICI